jgi:hypothetical protein
MEVIKPLKEYLVRDELNQVEEEWKKINAAKEDLNKQEDEIKIQWVAINEEWVKIKIIKKSFEKSKKINIKTISDSKTYSLEEIRVKYPKAYTIWTQEDDEYLTQAFLQNNSTTSIAEELQRQPSAINARLAKLNLK